MNIYTEISFLDDQHINEYINDCPVIGSIDEMSSYYIEYENIFIAIGNNQLRKKLIQQAELIGYTIINLISHNSVVSDFALLGQGIVIFPNVVIEANAKIGDGCIISSNTTINHDAIVEAYALVYCQSVIRPNVLIKSLCIIGNHCTIKTNTIVNKGTVINDGCVIENSTESGGLLCIETV